ncbi:MAG: TIGR00730 family Rossman fold protein [Bacteroidetes bacterium]|nr:TIGR00730 family Rossman fold protein [Bacteroidota bacterium]
MTENNKFFRPKKLSIEEIKSGCVYVYGKDSDEAQICLMNEEFRQGFDIVKKNKDGKKSVTFWGSARLPVDNEYYQKALRLSRRLASEADCMVVTGGGPGIMEAGNRGAYEEGKPSLGLTINLPHEQNTNQYVTEDIPFYFFFTRKTLMAYSAEAYLYFPGGFGTLDELFEILTLVQTEKISKLPIVLVGKKFWEPLDSFIRQALLAENQTISEEDLKLYTILDDEDEIVNIVKSAPMRND